MALDRSADDARPYLEAAGATHTALIDTEHRVADLYGIINVPTVVWINEQTSMTGMAHLTCAAHSRAELEDILTRYATAGVQNVLSKSIGTTNPHNVIKATFDALKKLKNKEAVAALRGKNAEDL